MLYPNVSATTPLSTRGNALTAASFAPAITAPSGCNLAWSPDGATLAYTVHPDNNCDASVEKIVFVDAATGAITEHVVPISTAGTRVLPVGWVVAP
ncbi:MAG: hypothetical protein H7Y11_11145 [Armatimonadetes bacterium]|nr:hypothetical protein [Anaerolineae bacterium]